jgi:hypothetical protein
VDAEPIDGCGLLELPVHGTADLHAREIIADQRNKVLKDRILVIIVAIKRRINFFDR